ncbi:MAG: VWA domain-containing protein [Bacteroidales bacterium]|nr:VWA domain-containing protein [Bacteroidales bacterium]
MSRAFRFEDEKYLLLLLALPVIYFVMLWIHYRYLKRMKNWGDFSLIIRLMPGASNFRFHLKTILILLAIASAVIALARPQFGSKLTEVKRKGIEIMIALDVSNSMMAEDIQPNRLENAKLAISRLIDRLENDKIGLIVFAGDAYIQLPITTDYNAAKLFLASVNTDIVPRQGTSIGSAIRLALRSFSPESDKSRTIIVITDGENHEEGAIQAAASAAEQGVKVHTIGMGSPKGVPIPVVLPGGQRNYRTDHEGNVIISKLNEQLLRQIAAETGGIYVRANNARTGLKTIIDEMNKLEKQEIKAQVYAEYDEQFPYFAGLALFLILLDVTVLNRKNRHLAKFFEPSNEQELTS